VHASCSAALPDREYLGHATSAGGGGPPGSCSDCKKDQEYAAEQAPVTTFVLSSHTSVQAFDAHIRVAASLQTCVPRTESKPDKTALCTLGSAVVHQKTVAADAPAVISSNPERTPTGKTLPPCETGISIGCREFVHCWSRLQPHSRGYVAAWLCCRQP
jgi:hypothetical protein